MRIYHIYSRKTEVFKYRLRINVHCLGNSNNFWCVSVYFSLLLLHICLQRTVQVGREALITLTQGTLRDTEGIHALEEAAAELYKALQASRDRGEFGVSVINLVMRCFQTWLPPWSVWRSIEHTILSSANACMNIHVSCLQLR